MSDTNIIAKETQDLSVEGEALISLFELALSTPFYFHAENTDQNIIFDSNTYEPFPILMEGIEITAEGAQNRPTLTLPNVESLIAADSEIRTTLQDFVLEDLIGVRITRRQTLKKYVQVGTDAAPANNYELPKAVYVIDRISSRNQLAVQLELASPFDLSGVRVPSRQVNGKYCPWYYKGYSFTNQDVRSACSWTSSLRTGEELYFTVDDEPLLLETLNIVTNASAWNNTSTYSEEDLVTFNNLLFMAKTNVPVDTQPQEESIYWKLCRTYSDYTTDAASKQYSVDLIDGRKSSYVYYEKNVYKCLQNNQKQDGKTPGSFKFFWAPGDVCGKLLSSCKTRYQARLRSTGSQTVNSVNHGVPQVGVFATEVALPFGGFPGTRKFR